MAEKPREIDLTGIYVRIDILDGKGVHGSVAVTCTPGFPMAAQIQLLRSTADGLERGPELELDTSPCPCCERYPCDPDICKDFACCPRCY